MQPRTRLAFKVAATLSFAAAAYCALWIWASVDLAFVPCNGTFSLSAPTFRCRQPQVAMILSALFLIVAIALLRAARAPRDTSES